MLVGSCRRLTASTLVIGLASAMPLILGTSGLLPVASRNLAPRSTRPATRRQS